MKTDNGATMRSKQHVNRQYIGKHYEKEEFEKQQDRLQKELRFVARNHQQIWGEK